MDWFLHAVRHYAEWQGRARRREYWCFMGLYGLISVYLTVIDAVVGHAGSRGHGGGVALLSTLFALAMLPPAVGVAIRRLHDTGRSGWWLLLGAVPVLGAAALLVLALRRGTPGPNAHGPVPPAGPERM